MSFVAPRPLALALVLPLAGLGAAAELGPPALTGADYARARRSADDLVHLAAEIEGRIREAVLAHFDEAEIDVELLGTDEVKVLLKVRTREMAYPEVQQSLQLLARTINQEVLGKHYRDKRLSPSSALVVLNRREGTVPEAPSPPPRLADAPPRLAEAPSRAPRGPSGEVARAATSPALRAGGRLADLARRLRERAGRSRPTVSERIPGDPGPIAAAAGAVLPGSAGLGLPPKPKPPPAPRVPEPLVLSGPEGLGAIPAAPAPRESLLDELARIDNPGPSAAPAPRRRVPRLQGEGMTFLLGEHLASLGALEAPQEAVRRPAPKPVVAPAPVAAPVVALLAELSEVEEAVEAEGFAHDRPLPLPKAGPPPSSRHLHASVPVRFLPRPRRPSPRPQRRVRPRPARPSMRPRLDPVTARRLELEEEIFSARGQPVREARAALPPIESVPVSAPVPVPAPVPAPVSAPAPAPVVRRPPPRPASPPAPPGPAPRRVRSTWAEDGELAPDELQELAEFDVEEAGFYLGEGEQEEFDEAVDDAWLSEAF